MPEKNIEAMTLEEILRKDPKEISQIVRDDLKNRLEKPELKKELLRIACIVMVHGPIDKEIEDYLEKLKKIKNMGILFGDPGLNEVVERYDENYVGALMDPAKKLLHLYLGKAQIIAEHRLIFALALVYLADFAKKGALTQGFIAKTGQRVKVFTRESLSFTNEPKSELALRESIKKILGVLSRYVLEKGERGYDLNVKEDTKAAIDLLSHLITEHDTLVKRPCVADMKM